MNKKKLLKRGIAVIVILALVYVFLFPLGFFYISKPQIGEYRGILTDQYEALNLNMEETYTLPEQYHYFGRYMTVHDKEYEQWLNGDRNTKPLINDRQVNKIFFSYNEKTYYLYCALQADIEEKHSSAFYYTWPDIYDAATDKVAFTLRENPEGFVICDNYLYYSYGKNYYSKRTCHYYVPQGVFNYYHYKDYRYARLNLDTLENEKIPKQNYKETLREQHYEMISERNRETQGEQYDEIFNAPIQQYE